jgi:hypothetical protein
MELVGMDFSITAQILEMDFAEFKTKKRVEMDFCMTTKEQASLRYKGHRRLVMRTI